MIGTLAAVGLVANVGAVVVALYLSAVLLKRASRQRGEMSQVCVVTGSLLVPLLLVSWFVYDGDLSALISSPDENPANWWVLPITAGDGEEATSVNLLRAGVSIAVLFAAATVLVGIGSSLYYRRKHTEFLSIHKALIKWPIVIIGCLIVLKIDLGTILLGTSVAVIGIGFVLKETLENIFTGISVEMEGTVQRGDWIQVQDDVGIVYEKTWRATKIQTLTDKSITIPNRLLGSEVVTNYDRPERPHARLIYVGASYKDPPVKVKEILRSILIREDEVLDEPLPVVRTKSYDDFSINYEMKYWIDSYSQHNNIEDRIMTRIWYAFRFYGVEIPFPIRNVHLKEREQLASESAAIEAGSQSRMDFLGALETFASLTAKELDFLAQNAFQREYGPGEHVIHKGEVGDALHVVREGSCEAVLPEGRRAPLEEGRYFGEMGLLNPGPRTADVVASARGATVMRIDKHCMDVLFRANPGLREQFEKVEAIRREELPVEAATDTSRALPLLVRLQRGARDLLVPW